MAINERVITGTQAAAADGGAASAEQNLILHLDANDVDSYDGDGSVWYDISEHDVTIPLSDNADDLEFHINPSDSSSYGGTGNTITDLSGGATVTKDTGIDFDIDNGGYFDKTNTEDITTNYSPDNLTEFTAELWVNPNSVTQNVSTLLTVTDSSNNNTLLIMYLRSNQRQIQFSTYYGASSFVRWNPTGDTSVQTGKWNHLAMTCKNNGKMVIYLDGEVKQTLDFPHTMVTSVANLEIGHIPSSSSYGFNGKMGAVRFYSKQLSASEIGQNYRHGRDYIYTGLVSDSKLHLDPTSYSGSGSTWTADVGNNGTITGATYDQELGDWFNFDGVSDYITVSNFTELNSGARSYEVWCNPDALNYLDHVMGRYGTTSTNYDFFIRQATSGGCEVGFYTSGGTVASNFTESGMFTAGEWVHIVVTCEGDASGDNIKLYKNGEQLGNTRTFSAARNTSTTIDLYIGALEGYTTQYEWTGKIGQVRTYQKELTADEVMQNYLYTKNDYPNGNNGTLSGGLSSSDWNSDGYFSLDGSSDFIQIPTNTAYASATHWSVAMWINPTSIAADEMLATLYGSSSDQKFDIRFNNSSGNIRFVAGTSSGGYNSAQNLTSTTALSTSTWHHLVCVYDDTNDKMYIYIDGSLDATKTGASNGTYTSITDPILIGKRTDNYHSNIKLSDFKFYAKALTAAEVTAEYNKGQFGEN